MAQSIMGNNPLCNGKFHSGKFLGLWDSSQPMIVLAQKLSALIEDNGYNYKSLALAAGLGETSVRDIVVGRSKNPRTDTIEKIASVLGVRASDIMGDTEPAMTKVVGYVGAGVVYAYDDYPQGGGMEDVPCPSGLEHKNIISVRVKGESMRPALRDGWLLFYEKKREGVPNDCINQMCIVCIEDNGMMVRDVQKGSKAGLYHLIAYNGESQFDVKLVWASKVLDIIPK